MGGIFYQQNASPGTIYAPMRPESGGAAFELFWPLPEWPPPLFFGDPAGQSVFRGASWGNKLAPWRGSTNWKRITGITKDINDAVVGGATVKVYRTFDDSLLGTTVSAADGAYEIGVSDLFNCYLVAYKAGSPDIAGTTVNTVQGS